MSSSRPGRSTTATSRRHSGFTLLEVLAAVAILGIWYIILATVGMQGLQAQGQSYRRLQASFIADEVIAEIETGFSSGQAPTEGIQESQREDFEVEYEVRVEVSSYDLHVPPLDSNASSLSGSSLDVPSVEVPNILGRGGLASPSPLRSIRVLVSWVEGHDEQTVIRDTFAFDLESVRSDLEALESAIALNEAEQRENEAPEGAEDAQTAAELRAQLPQ